MPETIEQYKKRMMDSQAGQDPLKVQASTSAKIERLLQRVPRKHLTKRPAPGKWSVAEIVAHLAESEIVVAYRMRMILGAPGTPIQAFDQDKWAAAGKYAKRDANESLELFRAVRKANLALLKSLDPTQWKVYGVHAERGMESIGKIAALEAGHDINHLQQIEAILGKRRGKQ